MRTGSSALVRVARALRLSSTDTARGALHLAMPRARRLLLCALATSCSGGALSAGPGATATDGGSGTEAGASSDDAGALSTDATTVGDGNGSLDAGSLEDAPSYRDALAQPFASTSIWNTAHRLRGDVRPARRSSPLRGARSQGDEDIIVLSPTSPSTPIYTQHGGLEPERQPVPLRRRPAHLSTSQSLPTSSSATRPSRTPRTPGSLRCWRTVARSGRRSPLRVAPPVLRRRATTVFPDVDLYGAGIPGAHGGSGLSAIGGTLRVGRAAPGAPPPHHVLKLELWAAKNYYNDGKRPTASAGPRRTATATSTTPRAR